MSQNFAVVALILATLNPFVFLQSLEVSTETITTMLFIYSIILLTSDEFKAKGLLLGMVNIGLIAIRPEFLFISMTSIVIYYLLLNFNPNKLIIPILLVALSLNFWGFQNKKATGSYMLLTNATSFQLWLGSTETVYENYPLKFQNTTKFSKDQFHQFISDIEKVKRKYDFNGTVTDLPRQSTAWLSEYKNNVGQDKLGYLQNYLIKCLVFWRPFLNPSSYGQGMVLVSFIILFPFMVCSFIGYVLALRRRIFYREIVVLTNCLIILTIIHALQMPDFRYRVPIQIPTMSIFAVYFLNTISKSFLEKKKTY